jgi:hypothetical protein
MGEGGEPVGYEPLRRVMEQPHDHHRASATVGPVQRFDSFLATGSGSGSVELDLDTDVATVRLRSRWMGVQRPERFELRFEHRTRAEHHGVLALTGATADGVAVPMPTGDEALLPLSVEYLRVPSTGVYLHPESPLADMAPLGYAEWTQRFDLLLLVVEDYAWPEAEPWVHFRETLDKAKLETTRD